MRWHNLPHHYPTYHWMHLWSCPWGDCIARSEPNNRAVRGFGRGRFQTCPYGYMHVNTGMGVIKRHGLPEIVRGFKTFSSRRINQFRSIPTNPALKNFFHLLQLFLTARHGIANTMGITSPEQFPNCFFVISVCQYIGFQFTTAHLLKIRLH